MSGRPTANPSGALAVGTNLVVAGKFTLNSIQLVGDGTNAGTVTVYDNIVASGKVMAVLNVPAATTTVLSSQIVFDVAVKAELGITVVVAGGASVAYVTTGGV